METKNFNKTSINIVVLGSKGVGKSTFIVRFIQGLFIQDLASLKEDYYRKSFVVDNISRCLEIFDSSLNSDYDSSLRDEYMRTADGFIIIYSSTDSSSLQEVDQIYEHILKCTGTDSVPLVLVRNKSDIGDQENFEAGKNLSEKLKCKFFETSSKEGTNVTECIITLVCLIDILQQKKFKRSHCLLI
jgi:small GTP-binding protein